VIGRAILEGWPSGSRDAALLFAVNLQRKPARKMTLPEAVDLALKQNSDLKIIREKLQKAVLCNRGACGTELPRVKTADDDLAVAGRRPSTFGWSFGHLPGLARSRTVRRQSIR